MSRRTQQLLGTALALVMAAGCEDSNEPIPTPAIGITFASTSMSAPRGQSRTFPVTVTRSGGFSGTVTVSITGLPQDLSVGCSPSAVLGSSCTLTIAPGPSASLGDFTATAKATGAGVAAKTVLLTITVTP
jgi:hypothetical protein